MPVLPAAGLLNLWVVFRLLAVPPVVTSSRMLETALEEDFDAWLSQPMMPAPL